MLTAGSAVVEPGLFSGAQIANADDLEVLRAGLPLQGNVVVGTID